MGERPPPVVQPVATLWAKAPSPVADRSSGPVESGTMFPTNRGESNPSYYTGVENTAFIVLPPPGRVIQALLGFRLNARLPSVVALTPNLVPPEDDTGDRGFPEPPEE
jgi:hypothetical protein